MGPRKIKAATAAAGIPGIGNASRRQAVPGHKFPAAAADMGPREVGNATAADMGPRKLLLSSCRQDEAKLSSCQPAVKDDKDANEEGAASAAHIKLLGSLKSTGQDAEKNAAVQIMNNLS